MTKKKFRFEWDLGNILKNWQKHKIRPFEAEEAINDKFAVIDIDQGHSEIEDRWILLGKTRKNKILYIAFTLRNDRIRVISMRIANKKEVLVYEKAIDLT
jgi:uncharacterized protein